MMTTNNINIALPFRHLNEDEMSSMYRCDSTHGEGKLNWLRATEDGCLI